MERVYQTNTKRVTEKLLGYSEQNVRLKTKTKCKNECVKHMLTWVKTGGASG